MGLSTLAQSYKTFFLDQPHGTANVKTLALEITGGAELEGLVELCQGKQPYPIPEAAAWTIRYAITKLPELQTKAGSALLKTLPEINRDSYIKNVLGIIKHHPISDILYGRLADACLNYLSEPFRSKAVHYYSVEIMTVICMNVPELTREFLLLAAELEPRSSNAMQRKLVKVRKLLNKKRKT
ncbi:MAG: hypothetical protein AB8B53_10875 [Flavobacteriales bacterium]